mgnify:CR=1 FL=1
MKNLQILFFMGMLSEIQGMDSISQEKILEIQKLKEERKILVKKFFNDDYYSYDQINESLVLNGFRLLMLDPTLRIRFLGELQQKKIEREERKIEREQRQIEREQRLAALQKLRERERKKRCKQSIFSSLFIE